MNIAVENIKKAISKGISVEAYVFLAIINDGCLHLFTENTFASVAKQLEMNGMCTGNEITEKGRKLLEEIEGNASNKVDNSNRYQELHKKLQAELLRLVNKKQIKANGGYTFLCNEIDLRNKLSRCISKYKLKDWDKIEKLLILHINKSYKKNFDKVLLVQYYIEKNGMSNLASDYEEFSTDNYKVEEKTDFDGINI